MSDQTKLRTRAVPEGAKAYRLELALGDRILYVHDTRATSGKAGIDQSYLMLRCATAGANASRETCPTIAALRAALRAVLPYAESRLEDMEEDHGRLERLNGSDRAYSPETISESLAYIEKARAAFQAARAALALADGGR